MPAYVVGDIHMIAPTAYRGHVPVALTTIARFGGHIIAGGNRIELLDGSTASRTRPAALRSGPATVRADRT